MKRVLLTAFVFPLAALITSSCAIDDAPPPAGGSSGAAGANTAGTNASGGSGGATGGSGGATGGSAGTDTTGGAGGTGGATGGDVTGGSAGATGGAAGATGGAAGATGGATGETPDAAAGAGGGGPARDASRDTNTPPPAETGPVTGGTVTIDSFAGVANMMNDKFADSFYVVPCVGIPGDQDCLTTPGGVCPNQNRALPMEQQGLVTSEDFKMGGVAGTNYQVTIAVNGIVEGKYYMGCTRAAGNAAPVNPDSTPQNTFCTGGTPVDVENYNIYKLMVLQPNGTTEVQHYYLNSFPTGTSFNAENHNSFAIAYTATITVPGQGVVRYYTADRNCHAIDNCGPGAGRTAACQITDGRTIPNEATLVFPPTYRGMPFASLNSRNGAAQPFHAQIIHVKVTGVTAM